MSPPPGTMTIAVPLLSFGDGLNMVIVGRVTFAIISSFHTLEKVLFLRIVLLFRSGRDPGVERNDILRPCNSHHRQNCENKRNKERFHGGASLSQNATSQNAGNYSSSRKRAVRTSSRSALFISRTPTVARPIAVIPTMRGPSTAKCSSQISDRGLNKRIV